MVDACVTFIPNTPNTHSAPAQHPQYLQHADNTDNTHVATPTQHPQHPHNTHDTHTRPTALTQHPPQHLPLRDRGGEHNVQGKSLGSLFPRLRPSSSEPAGASFEPSTAYQGSTKSNEGCGFPERRRRRGRKEADVWRLLSTMRW